MDNFSYSKRRSQSLTPPQISVIKTRVKELDLRYVRPQRAGVILFTYVDKDIYFGLGLDHPTHDLTDFGGSVIYKKDINVINGAMREFYEETLNILEPIPVEKLGQCPVLYDSTNLIIFLHINVDPDLFSKVFNERYKEVVEMLESNPKARRPEVCGVTWVNWEDFQKIIQKEGCLFSRVQKFLSRAGDFSYII